MSQKKKSLARKPKSEIQKELGRRTPSRGKAANRPTERRGRNAMKPTRGK